MQPKCKRKKFFKAEPNFVCVYIILTTHPPQMVAFLSYYLYMPDTCAIPRTTLGL